MKRIKLCYMSILVLMSITIANASPDRSGDFSLLDTEGNFHQLSRYRHQDALVLMAFNESCSSMDNALSKFKKLQERFEDKPLSFALIRSPSRMGTEYVGNDRALDALNMPLLLDDGQLVSEAIAFSKIGEIAVLDPQQLGILYRGGISEKANAVLIGQAETEGATIMEAADGCDLRYPVKERHTSLVPDYASEIAPIIQDKCASCHREDGIGPFAMDSHLMLQGWSPMIKEVLLTKRMPPAQVDPSIGHFTNARYISDLDMQKLVHWIDAGSPRGASLEDPLAQIEFSNRFDWQLGEPDYIVTAPKYEIPATGVLDYINVDVALPFKEDKWVEAVQYIAGDESVLHHLLTYVTAPKEKVEGEAARGNATTRFLEGYAPGKVDAMTFPKNTGVYIPANHKLSMQFHYTTNGRATSDQTILGLYFHDEPPRHENFTQSVSGMFRIPAYARDYEASARYLFKEDTVVTGLRAHMHFRGKDMRFSAEYPDGRFSELLSVPNYSYAWQPTYELAEPVLLPAGTKVHVTGAFDNSEHNPANPDPSKELTFGLQSWDEMFIGYWTYHSAKPIKSEK